MFDQNWNILWYVNEVCSQCIYLYTSYLIKILCFTLYILKILSSSKRERLLTLALILMNNKIFEYICQTNILLELWMSFQVSSKPSKKELKNHLTSKKEFTIWEVSSRWRSQDLMDNWRLEWEKISQDFKI